MNILQSLAETFNVVIDVWFQMINYVFNSQPLGFLIDGTGRPLIDGIVQFFFGLLTLFVPGVDLNVLATLNGFEVLIFFGTYILVVFSLIGIIATIVDKIVGIVLP